MENPLNKMMKVIKINMNIKRSLFGLSFSDLNIEKEYLLSEMKINTTMKLMMNFLYILNFIDKNFQDRFKKQIYSAIILYLCSIFLSASIIGYYVSRK